VASYRDLLDAIARIGASTGNPDAWKDGLTGEDVAVACTPMSPPAAIAAVLAKMTVAHPAVFGPSTTNGPLPSSAEGDTAEAVRNAESALARQHSDAAHLDLQVLTAIVNAHATAADGVAQLSELQREIETAVAARTDLDTPAGAREFQRYLIGKMRDIHSVVESARLDATSRATLAEALLALYKAATPEVPDRAPADAGLRSDPAVDRAEKPSRPAPHDRGPVNLEDFDAGVPVSTAVDEAVSPLPESVWTDLLSDPALAPASSVAPAVAPTTPVPVAPFGGAIPATTMPAAPFGGAMPAAPFGGTMPAAPFGPSGGSFGGLPNLPDSSWPDTSPAALSELFGNDGRGHDETRADKPADTADEALTDDAVHDPTDPSDEPPTTGAETPVLLPDGQTVLAPSAELASVINAAVAGAPIPEAFRWQGMTIPAPGSPVTAPVDPARLVPGDIAVLADRHALALGNGTVLLDQQIQPISSVTGPGFIGWQHPPEPEPLNSPPVIPAPDRTAATTPS